MFEPKIIGFLCNWCSYAGADLAGVSRFNYPPNLRIIRVMCSGRIDPIFLLNAFTWGFDGVLLTGCHLGDCHYLTGNYHAKYKFLLIRKILDKIGFETRRLRLEWISAAEGKKFADTVTEFTEVLRALGPSSVKSNPKLQENLLYAEKICSDFRIRWLISRARDLIADGNVYGERIPDDKFDKMLDEIVQDELMKTKILHLIEENGMSAEDISRILQEPVENIMNYLITLNDEHAISFQVLENQAIFNIMGDR